jgi:4'-phosphopantetheinyl transferase
MRYTKINDRKRGLISELLVRYLISIKSNIKSNQIILDKGKYGKPFVKNISGIEYNVSHSGQFVVCAIGNHPVGIDVEQILNFDLSICNKIFETKEYEVFQQINNFEKLEYFYRMWSLKESFIKAKGCGLYMKLNSVRINAANENNIYCFYQGNKYYFKEYKIDLCYKLSICSNIKEFPNEIKIFNFEEFYNLIETKCLPIII